MIIYKLPLITNTHRSYCLSGFLSVNERRQWYFLYTMTIIRICKTNSNMSI